MTRPRIRTILLAVNLVVLLLPLVGIGGLRIYESALIRQTETELNAQGATLAAIYRQLWMADAKPEALGLMPRIAVASKAGYIALDPEMDPRLPTLDLANDPVLPPPEPAQPATGPAEPLAAEVGRQLGGVLRDTRRVTLAAIRLLDRNGIVVATSGDEGGFDLSGLAEVKEALAGGRVASLRLKGDGYGVVMPWSLSRGGSVRVFVAHPVLAEDRVLGAVLLSRTPTTAQQVLFGKWREILLAGFLVLAIVGGIGLLTAFAIARPIRSVMLEARRVAAGGAPALRRPTGLVTREAADLAQSIEQMALTLEARADYVRTFATEASHEFKTPLASMRGAVELLRDHWREMREDERQRFLDNLGGDVGRLDRLVHRMLELARAETAGDAGAARSGIEAVVARIAGRYRELGLRIDYRGEAGLSAAVPEEVLALALENLLDNVLRHAGFGARVSIDWRQEPDGLQIVVADDGRGISPANASRIFDRFFTTAREQGGTGLGLSIVRARLAACRANIRLLPSQKGSTFEIALPG